ncbi:MAG: DUF434 domain-containing protein [Verrucomicrobia bacterium]|nr:DUF434 domain-containing protein [Verrucomicrobiota bacterium]
MPDTRIHRGPHPEDAKLFAPAAWPALQHATGDMSWLLGRGYAAPSAMKLVGDRYQLAVRQRMAVQRSACPDEARAVREARRAGVAGVLDRPLWIDGYNVLTTVEVALGGGVILAARDGTYRDIASMHGTYRKVEETVKALELLGRPATVRAAGEWVWFLDRPVSNSGRLRRLMEEMAAQHGWRWRVELVDDPDHVLGASGEIVATADSVVLDRCQRWFNLAREVIDTEVPHARIVPMAETTEAPPPAELESPATAGT